jgi:hypothetical protein
MLLKTQKLAEVKPPRERLKLRWNVLFEDLRLLASVALGHFIIWRTLRRRHRENSARRRDFKLLRGEESMPQAQSQVMRGFDWRASAGTNGNRILPHRSKQGG